MIVSLLSSGSGKKIVFSLDFFNNFRYVAFRRFRVADTKLRFSIPFFVLYCSLNVNTFILLDLIIFRGYMITIVDYFSCRYGEFV